MLGKRYTASLCAAALASLFLTCPTWAKSKDYKDSSKDKSSKDYSSKDYSSSSSKDYHGSLVSPPSATVPNGQPQPQDQQKVKTSSSDRYLMHIHDVLAPADDEWQVLLPRIEKVVNLQKEVGAGRDPKGPHAPSSKELARMAENNSTLAGSAKPATPVSDASRALNMTLSDQAAQLADLRAKVAAARDARARVKTELTRAQEDLRGLLTVRQEAALIVMGLLD